VRARPVVMVCRTFDHGALQLGSANKLAVICENKILSIGPIYAKKMCISQVFIYTDVPFLAGDLEPYIRRSSWHKSNRMLALVPEKNNVLSKQKQGFRMFF